MKGEENTYDVEDGDLGAEPRDRALVLVGGGHGVLQDAGKGHICFSRNWGQWKMALLIDSLFKKANLCLDNSGFGKTPTNGMPDCHRFD